MHGDRVCQEHAAEEHGGQMSHRESPFGAVRSQGKESLATFAVEGRQGRSPSCAGLGDGDPDRPFGLHQLFMDASLALSPTGG